MKMRTKLLPFLLFAILCLVLSAGCMSQGHSEEDYEDHHKAMEEFAEKVNASAEYYDQMVESDPGNATAWCFRAMYYNDNFNQYDQALESVNRSLEIDPEFGLAWYVKGYILLNSGDKEGASLCFDNAVNYDPSLLGSVPDVDSFRTGGSEFIGISYRAK